MKSGRYLLILQFIGSTVGLANRYIDIQTGVETRFLDAAGSGNLGHHDTAGYIVGADRWNALPNTTIMNYLNPSVTKGPTINYNYNWDLVQANHLTHGNAKAGIPLDQEFVCAE
jgi:hypothetical protein